MRFPRAVTISLSLAAHTPSLTNRVVLTTVARPSREDRCWPEVMRGVLVTGVA